MKGKLTIANIESSGKPLRFCQMDWNDKGARCASNIPGMQCPRCGEILTEAEHTCGKPPKARKITESETNNILNRL